MIQEYTIELMGNCHIKMEKEIKLPTENQAVAHCTIINSTGENLLLKAKCSDGGKVINCEMDSTGEGFIFPRFRNIGYKDLMVYGYTLNSAGDYVITYSPEPVTFYVPKGCFTNKGEDVTPTERDELEKEIAVLRADQAEINTAQASVNADLTAFKAVFENMNILTPGEADPTGTTSGTGTQADPFIFDGAEVSYILTNGCYWTHIEDFELNCVQLNTDLTVLTVGTRGILTLPLEDYGTLTYYRYAYDEQTGLFFFDTISWDNYLHSLEQAIEYKQDAFEAGDNIIINGARISAIDTTYDAGRDISITNNTISVIKSNSVAGNDDSPVTSKAVYNYKSTTVQSGDTKPVTSDAVYNYKSDTVYPRDTRPVTSDAVYNYKSTTVYSGGTKPVTSGAVYDAIQTAIGGAITSVLGGSY